MKATQSKLLGAAGTGLCNVRLPPLSRRALLRGAAGVAIGLPLLEAMQPRQAAAQGAGPRRIVFEFKPNGDRTLSRMLDEDPTRFVFGEFLEPLEPYRDDLLILNRLDKRYGNLQRTERGDNHQQGSMGLAPWPQGAGDFTVFGEDRRIGYVLGPSVDVAIGDAVLQTQPNMPYRHLAYRVGGVQNNINNHASHAGPVGTQNPIPPETDPQAAYLRLFGAADDDAEAMAERRARLVMKQSVLDLVTDESVKLGARLGAADKQKVEQFTESLRDIERTLVPPERGPSCVPAGVGDAVNAYVDDSHAVVGAQFQRLITLAFACDLTRVANFAWGGGVNTRVYRELMLTEPHHDLSHVSTEAAYAQIRAIHRHLWTQSTGLFEALKATPEGDGTLWDNTLVVHWNELGQGDVHSIDDQLVVFAGGGGGYFERGRYRDFANDVGFSQMLLSCLHYMGLETLAGFGDPRLAEGGPVPAITA